MTKVKHRSNYHLMHDIRYLILTDGRFKRKHPESGGARREITCWHQAEESDAEGGGFRRLIPASDLPTRTTRRMGVFLLYRTYLWNKQQVMLINLTTWSTMQYHVVVDHLAFYVIHSQVRYNGVNCGYQEEPSSPSNTSHMMMNKIIIFCAVHNFRRC